MNAALSIRTDSDSPPLKPGWIGILAVYLVFAAVVARTLAIEALGPVLPRYLGLELVYLLLFTAGMLQRRLPDWLKHVNFVFQSILVWWMLSLRPEFDFVILLFLLLCYLVSLSFSGKLRWFWIMGLVLQSGASLIFYHGFFRGLALALTTMAGEIVIPAYLIANQEIELARAASQKYLNELEQTHQQLEAYARQVEELAAMQERNRLARELHDTVSQLIFSIALTTRSAQLLLEQNPSRVAEQLLNLQTMSADALGQLRAFIKQLRPPQKS